MTLQQILDTHPWLADFECPNCPAVEQHKFELAVAWFKTKPKIDNRCCYSHKYDAEVMFGQSIGQRAFMAAAIATGVSIRFAPTGTAFLAVV